ncbi:hypothetical protein KSS87_006878 [Heliosperma pusillum]|nr:hypothetical protein KSS87_006878 [Heliosperma pusillum]
MSLNSVRSPFTFYTKSCYITNIRHRRRNPYLLFLEKSLLKPCTSFSISFGDGSVSTKAASGQHNNNVSSVSEETKRVFLEDEVIIKASSLNDANQVVEMIGESVGSCGISNADCCRMIKAALDCNNTNLALSIFAAMRSSAFDQGVQENGNFAERWRWPRPELSAYTILVIGLSASLRVSDALKIIDDICRVGLSSVEEVPFGKIVRCPSCLIAVAVAQPQQGIQIASCAKCRYQYELVSGDIVNIASEEISMDIPAWKRWLGSLPMTKQAIPSAVHSIVIQTPSGVARTHRFATETAEVPAQEGERVTIAVAAPTNVFREVGPFRFSPKSPKYYPSEPLCLTNHRDERESLLLRAPPTDGKLSLVSPSFILPLLVVLASGDAASGFIDPSLPRLLPAAVAASLAVGATLNTMVLPQMGQISQRLTDVTAVKQQLLAQYDMLQSRIKDLKKAAENEVWMLARMCQLENKILAVGEPSYRARRNRIKKVRESLESSLKGRIELIDSYARISSMIEIEVEMDTNVLAAEATGNTENVAKQIQQMMELENLEERWKLQAEANDEVERLLSTEPLSTEQL